LFLLGLTVLHAGRAQDAPHLYPIVENGKLGFIDASGKEAIPPRFEGYECFRPLTQFSEGLAPVHIDAASERWGYIETTGKLVLTLPAHYSIRLDLNGAFHEGVANVTITSPPTGGGLDRWAWIDRAGRLYICQFGAGRILVCGPDGGFITAIEIPDRDITNMAFGPGETSLFVTAASDSWTEPYPGTVYRLDNPMVLPPHGRQ